MGIQCNTWEENQQNAYSAIPDDSQLRPAVSHRMLVVLTADQRGAAVLIAGKPT